MLELSRERTQKGKREGEATSPDIGESSGARPRTISALKTRGV